MRSILIWILAISWLFWVSCEQSDMPNPFDDINANQDTVKLKLTEADSGSFAGIYINVFKPTCANVGCHDGTFEPDFRTLESSYNTLIFQEPIKNDGLYTYRVHPGNTESSVLLARLGGALTPLMPVQIEPDSDWGKNQGRYYEQIRAWIAAGAPDITGAIPTLESPTPRMQGVIARHQGQLINRSGANGPLLIHSNYEEIELLLSFGHEEMDPKLLTHNKIGFSSDPHEFEQPIELDLTILDQPLLERGFHGQLVPFTHSVFINPNTFFTEASQIFFRAYVKDENNPVTEIPTKHGIFYIKTYMSFRQN